MPASVSRAVDVQRYLRCPARARHFTQCYGAPYSTPPLPHTVHSIVPLHVNMFGHTQHSGSPPGTHTALGLCKRKSLVFPLHKWMPRVWTAAFLAAAKICSAIRVFEISKYEISSLLYY